MTATTIKTTIATIYTDCINGHHLGVQLHKVDNEPSHKLTAFVDNDGQTYEREYRLDGTDRRYIDAYREAKDWAIAEASKK